MLLGRGAPVSPSCCREQPRRPSLVRRGLDIAGYLVPAGILALLPKCPLCLAAYIAVGTGFGIATSTAVHLRTLLLVGCVACLAVMAAKHAVRWMG